MGSLAQPLTPPMRQSERLLLNLVATSIRFGGELVIGILLTPILLWQLGFEVFGFLMTIGASGLLLSMVTQAIQLSVARELGFSLGAGDSGRLKRTFSTAFFLQIGITLLFCSAAILACPLIVQLLTVPAGYERIGYAALVMTVLQLGYGIAVSPFGGLLRAHQDLQTVSLLQFLLKLSALVAALAMVVWNGNKLLFYVAALFLFSLPIHSAYAVIALRRYAEAKPSASLVSPRAARTIMRFGAFSLLSFLGDHLRRNGLTVLLNIYYGNIASSASGIAARVAGLMLQVVNLVTAVVLPAMAANMGANKVSATERLIRIASSAVLAIAIPVTVTLMAHAGPVLATWLRQEIPDLAVLLVQFVVLSMAFSFVSVGHGLALSGRGDIGVLVTVNQALIVVSITVATILAVNLSLPPWWLFAGELAGVVFAFCLWQPYWVARRLHTTGREWERNTLAPAGAAVLLCTAIAFAAAQLLPPSMVRALIVGAATMPVSAAIMWTGSLRSDEKIEIFAILNRRWHELSRKRQPGTDDR